MRLHPSVRPQRHSPGPRTAANRPLRHKWSNLRLTEARKIRRRRADFSVASLSSYQTLFLDTPNGSWLDCDVNYNCSCELSLRSVLEFGWKYGYVSKMTCWVKRATHIRASWHLLLSLLLSSSLLG